MLVRHAVPVSLWQSVQWQTLTVAGSTSASYVTSPQSHPPVTFIVFSCRIGAAKTRQTVGSAPQRSVISHGSGSRRWNGSEVTGAVFDWRAPYGDTRRPSVLGFALPCRSAKRSLPLAALQPRRPFSPTPCGWSRQMPTLHRERVWQAVRRSPAVLQALPARCRMIAVAMKAVFLPPRLSNAECS